MEDKKEKLDANLLERSKRKGSFAKKLNRSKYIAFVLGGIAFAAIAIYLFGFGNLFTHKREENFYFTVQLTIHIIAILFALAVLQLKSIWKVNEFAKRRIKEAKEKGDDLRSNCKYCSHPTTNFVCPECDSIQWERSEITSYFYVFLAHHRWNVIRTILIFFLVGPLIYMLNVHFQRIDTIEARLEKQNDDVEHIISLSNDIRPKIYHLKIMAENDYIYTESADFSKEHYYLLERYFQYSWGLAKVIDGLKHQDAEDLTEREQFARSFLMTKRLVPTIDDHFMESMNDLEIAFHRVSDNDSLAFDEVLIDEAEKNLATLHQLTKAVSCAIGELSFNKGIRRPSCHDDCQNKEIIDDCYKDMKGAVDTILPPPRLMKNIRVPSFKRVSDYLDSIRIIEQVP